MGKRQKYNQQYKQEAVALVLQQDRSVTQAAGDLGIGKSTLDRSCQTEQNNLLK